MHRVIILSLDLGYNTKDINKPYINLGKMVRKYFGLLRHLFAHFCICMTRNLEGQLGALAPQTITITPEENEAIQRVS